MGIDSEALHQDAMKQQAARFEETISKLIAERDAARREAATVQAERDSLRRQACSDEKERIDLAAQLGDLHAQHANGVVNVAEAERDVILESLERLIDIGDDLAAMLSGSLGEVRTWRDVSAAAKAAPQMKQHKSVKEAHRARCSELTAQVRSLSEAVKKAGPLQPRIAVLEARLAAACSWIEHLGQYVTNDELVKAAAEFVRNESEMPF